MAPTMRSSLLSTSSFRTSLSAIRRRSPTLTFASATAWTKALLLDDFSPGTVTNLIYRRSDVVEHACQVAHLHFVNCSLDRTTFGVTKDHNELRAGELGRELQAAKDVWLDEIPGDARREDIAYALVEDELRRHSRIDASNNRGNWGLTKRGRAHLGQQIAVPHSLADEALIAVHERL